MQVFISYSSKIRPLVAALASDLEEAGYQVWFDQELSGGQEWWSEILKNLRACDALALALTPETLDSDPCRRELQYALTLGKPILPVMLADVDLAALPPALSQLQVIDYRKRDANAVLKLTRALNLLPTSPVLPDPLPPEPDAPLSPLSNLREQIDSASLSEPEQHEILEQFRALMEAGEADAQPLFERFLQRPDLLASVGRDAQRIRLRRSPRRRIKFSRRVWLIPIALAFIGIAALVLYGTSYHPVPDPEYYSLTIAGTPDIRVSWVAVRGNGYEAQTKPFFISPEVTVKIGEYSGWEEQLSGNGFYLKLPYENLDNQFLATLEVKLQDNNPGQSLRALAQDAVSQCRQLGYKEDGIVDLTQDLTQGEFVAENLNVSCRPLGRTDQDFTRVLGFKFFRLTNGAVIIATLTLDKEADFLSLAAHWAYAAMDEMTSTYDYLQHRIQFVVDETTPEATPETTPNR